MATPYQRMAHKGAGRGMRLIETCDGCTDKAAVSYARQLLAAAHPDWTLMRIHDRALILAIKMRKCDLVRISEGG